MNREHRAGPPRFATEDERNIWIDSENPPRGDEPTQRQFAMAQENKNEKRDKYDVAADAIHLGPVRLVEVTSKILSPLKKGEICRYGTTGWVLRCPQCNTLIIMEDDVHKTYVSRDGSYFRLTPSLVCPAPECSWHVFANILPESMDETPKEDKGEEDSNAPGTELAVV